MKMHLTAFALGLICASAVAAPVTYRWHDGVSFQTSTQEKGGKSPVFRDASGMRRSLPGGVLVAFRASTSEARVRAWAKAQGVKLLKKVVASAERVIWLVESPRGIASLNLANRIHQSETVEYASPNWLVQLEAK